ncbi:hypothetical protein ACJJTC_006559, partial [Scirpophaga incertulas]
PRQPPRSAGPSSIGSGIPLTLHAAQCRRAGLPHAAASAAALCRALFHRLRYTAHAARCSVSARGTSARSRVSRRALPGPLPSAQVYCSRCTLLSVGARDFRTQPRQPPRSAGPSSIGSGILLTLHAAQCRRAGLPHAAASAAALCRALFHRLRYTAHAARCSVSARGTSARSRVSRRALPGPLPSAQVYCSRCTLLSVGARDFRTQPRQPPRSAGPSSIGSGIPLTLHAAQCRRAGLPHAAASAAALCRALFHRLRYTAHAARCSVSARGTSARSRVSRRALPGPLPSAQVYCSRCTLLSVGARDFRTQPRQPPRSAGPSSIGSGIPLTLHAAQCRRAGLPHAAASAAALCRALFHRLRYTAHAARCSVSARGTSARSRASRRALPGPLPSAQVYRSRCTLLSVGARDFRTQPRQPPRSAGPSSIGSGILLTLHAAQCRRAGLPHAAASAAALCRALFHRLRYTAHAARCSVSARGTSARSRASRRALPGPLPSAQVYCSRCTLLSVGARDFRTQPRQPPRSAGPSSIGSGILLTLHAAQCRRAGLPHAAAPAAALCRALFHRLRYTAHAARCSVSARGTSARSRASRRALPGPLPSAQVYRSRCTLLSVGARDFRTQPRQPPRSAGPSSIGSGILLTLHAAQCRRAGLPHAAASAAALCRALFHRLRYTAHAARCSVSAPAATYHTPAHYRLTLNTRSTASEEKERHVALSHKIVI